MGIYDILVILCFVVGLGLSVVEACMPGFGIAGVSGVIVCLASVFFAYLGHGMTFALCLTGIELILLAIIVLMTLRSLKKGHLARKVILNDCEDAKAGEPETQLPAVGSDGIAVTALRPAGEADFFGKRFQVVCEDGFAARDDTVRVTGTDGKKVLVKTLKIRE